MLAALLIAAVTGAALMLMTGGRSTRPDGWDDSDDGEGVAWPRPRHPGGLTAATRPPASLDEEEERAWRDLIGATPAGRATHRA
ncbi:MAG TPA: hypothetical protein VNT60_10830 [Deinococcales bacterium]|nr:hypothetical protein [Deinococcales bacterium]